MKKYISCILTLTLLVSLITGVMVSAEPEVEVAAEAGTEEIVSSAITPQMIEAYKNTMKNKTPDNTGIDSIFTVISENENLALYAVTDKDSDRVGEIALLDKKSGYVWRSNPTEQNDDVIGKASGHAYYRTKSQMAISYAQGYNFFDTNTYYESVMSDKTEVFVEENSVKYLFKFRETEFAVPVRYSLEGDAFLAEILVNDEDAKFTYEIVGKVNAGGLGEMVEQEIQYNIMDIKLLPAFGATSYNEDGYLFIPDGSGALINMNNGKKNISQPYSAPVYGNYTDSQSTEYSMAHDRFMLPVFGTVKNDGHALMGIIKDNAAVSYVNAEVSGYESAYNKVYPSYLHKIIKGSDKEGNAQPMSKELRDPAKNFSVKYYCLSGDEASYVGMAKRYRKYLIDEQGMKKSDDLREGALFLDMYAGVEKQTSIMGIPWNKFEVMTTYEDIRDIADDMEKAGITDVVFKYNDWTKKSNRKKIQTAPNFEGSIGGKKGYLKTKEYLDSKNMSFYLNIDFMNFSESGHGYNRLSDAIKYPSQAPVYKSSGVTAHINMGSRWNLLKGYLVKEAALKFADKCAKYNINAVSIENIGSSVYSDGSNKGGHTRGECANYFADIIAEYKAKGINILTTKTSEYAIINSDILMDIPSKDTYIEIADEAVPFYQIAVRGYKTYTLEPVNMSSNHNNVVLNAVESGSNLLYNLVAGETTDLKETYLKYLYSCNYGQWKDTIIETYKEYYSVMSQVSGADIENHEKVAEGVYKTTYDNGVAVYVNYTENEFETANGTKVKANGYIAERGE